MTTVRDILLPDGLPLPSCLTPINDRTYRLNLATGLELYVTLHPNGRVTDDDEGAAPLGAYGEEDDPAESEYASVYMWLLSFGDGQYVANGPADTEYVSCEIEIYQAAAYLLQQQCKLANA